MKRIKKKICSLLLTVCMLMQGMCHPIIAGAADPPQTEGTVSVEIYHEHGSSSSGCYENVYHHCGGKVELTHDGDTFQIFTCQKCLYNWRGPHPDIHDGYYKKEMTCTADHTGSFYIERMTEGKKVYLVAGLIKLSDVIDDFSIEWGEEGEYASGSNEVLPLRRRGTFRATLTYHDKNLDQYFVKQLEYTDYTASLHVEYRNDGELIAETDLDYGTGLGDVDPLSKTGYEFCGYYDGDKRYYDEEGHPADYGLDTITDLELILEAKWKAAEYPFYYGADEDGDGIPDKSGVLTYDAAPPDLNIGEAAERKGYTFEGYFIEDAKVYDTAGKPLGIWRTVPARTPLILKERWTQNKYILRYGDDADGNGSPDRSISLVYGDALPSLDTPSGRDGYVFDGYYYDGRQIYNSSGRPVSGLPELFEKGSISLESKWHIKHYTLYYGEDRNGDSKPDGRIEIDHGGMIPYLDISLLAGKTGYIFGGYTVRGISICDSSGKGRGAFRPSFEEGSYTLEADWSPMSFTLYYGADGDGDGRADKTVTVVYDSMPPVLDMPDVSSHRGYRFDGYYLGDSKLFDGNGKPLSVWKIIPADGEDTLTESWKGINIVLRYGDDKDGDGVPDGRAEFAYGDMIPDLGLGSPAARIGYTFLGYYVDDVMLYGAGGHPQGSWLHFTEEKEYILSQKWQVKSYDVRYGKDEDGDGIPDRMMNVTYGEPYSDVEIPALKNTVIFDGYYLEEEMVFDEEGRALGNWVWDVDDPVLEIKSHVKKTAAEPSGEEDEGGEENGNGGEDGSDEDNNNETGGSSSENSVSENGSGSSSENSVSGNSAGNTIFTGISRHISNKVTDNKADSPDEVSAEDVNGESDPDTADEEGGMPVTNEEETDGSGDGGESEEETEEDGTLSIKTDEKKSSAALPAIRKVAKAGAVTVGGIGSVLAVYAGLVYVLAMAEVDTIRPDGSRKRLCKLSIHSEKGKAFMIRLSSSLQEKCETNRLCLKLPILFALRYKDHNIIVQSRGKLQEKRIGREIFVNI